MIPPPFTMVIDVGPNKIIVVSGNNLYEIAKKLVPSGVSQDIADRIKNAMSRKYKGFTAAEKHVLLEGMVELSVTYTQEWTSGQRLPWYKMSLPPPPAYYFELGD